MRNTLSGIALILFIFDIHAATVSVHIKDSSGQGLPDTVVYAMALNKTVPMAEKEIYIEQKNQTFRPFVSVVPKGTQAYFPNRDGIGHHVYSFSPAKTFQFPLSDEETSDSVSFDKAGVITVGCNIHDWMVAYIYVVDTHYYSISDTGGKATLSDLPEGEYSIHIWHPGIRDNADMEQPLSLESSQNIELEFSIPLKPVYFWRPAPPETEEEEY